MEHVGDLGLCKVKGSDKTILTLLRTSRDPKITAAELWQMFGSGSEMGRDVRRYVQPPGGSITDTLSNNFLKSVNIMPSFWYFSPREYHGKASNISQKRILYANVNPIWCGGPGDQIRARGAQWSIRGVDGEIDLFWVSLKALNSQSNFSLFTWNHALLSIWSVMLIKLWIVDHILRCLKILCQNKIFRAMLPCVSNFPLDFLARVNS